MGKDVSSPYSVMRHNTNKNTIHEDVSACRTESLLPSEPSTTHIIADDNNYSTKIDSSRVRRYGNRQSLFGHSLLSLVGLALLLLTFASTVSATSETPIGIPNPRLLVTAKQSNTITSVSFTATQLDSRKNPNSPSNYLLVVIEITLPPGFVPPEDTSQVVCTVRDNTGFLTVSTTVFKSGNSDIIRISLPSDQNSFSTSPSANTVFTCPNIRTPLLADTFYNGTQVPVRTTVELFHSRDLASRVKVAASSNVVVDLVGPGSIESASQTTNMFDSLAAHSDIISTVTVKRFHSQVQVSDLVAFTLPYWHPSRSDIPIVCTANHDGQPITITSTTYTISPTNEENPPFTVWMTIGTVIPDAEKDTNFICSNIMSPPYQRPESNGLITVMSSSQRLRDQSAMKITSLFPAILGSVNLRTITPKYATAGTIDDIYVVIHPLRTPILPDDWLQFILPNAWTTNAIYDHLKPANTTGWEPPKTDCTATIHNITDTIIKLVPLPITTTVHNTLFQIKMGGSIRANGEQLTITCSNVLTPLVEQPSDTPIEATTFFGTAAAPSTVRRASTNSMMVSRIAPGNLTRYGNVTVVPTEAIENTVTNLVITIPQMQTTLNPEDRICFRLPETWELNAGSGVGSAAATTCTLKFGSTDYTVTTTVPQGSKNVTITVGRLLPNSPNITTIICRNIRTPINPSPQANILLWTETPATSQFPTPRWRDATFFAGLSAIQPASLGFTQRTIDPDQTNTGYFGNLTLIINPVSVPLTFGSSIRLYLPDLWDVDVNNCTCTLTHQTTGLYIPVSDPTIVNTTNSGYVVNRITMNVLQYLPPGSIKIQCTGLRNPVYEVSQRNDITIDTLNILNGIEYVIERTITARLPQITRSPLGVRRAVGTLQGQVSGATSDLIVEIDSLYNELEIGDRFLIYMPSGWSYFAEGQHQTYLSRCDFFLESGDLIGEGETIFSYTPNLMMDISLIHRTGGRPRVPRRVPVRVRCTAIRAPLEGLPDWHGIRYETRSPAGAIKDEQTEGIIRNVTHK